MKLYLFNPAHDLALAHGSSHYIAPQIVKQFAYDFSLLPFWYAHEDSTLLLYDAKQLTFLEAYNALFNRKITGCFASELNNFSELKIHPWGWNYTLRKWLIERGVPSDYLPSKEEIQTLTTLSHRSSSVRLLPQLQLSSYFCGQSTLFHTLEQLKKFVEQYPSTVLKEPLSGSGRGIMWCKGELIPSLQTWAKRIIERQQGVVGEPVYSKVIDFAMEYELNSLGECRFLGYSLFYTSSLGSYEGNYLWTDEEIEKYLTRYVPVLELEHLKQEMPIQLKYLINSSYEGCLGVDMMICRFDDSPMYRIHPCVEINFRMNMGIVAGLITKNYLHPTVTGKFETHFYRKEKEALLKHQAMEQTHPVVLEGNKLKSGYLPLVPVTSTSRYRAWVLVE